MRFLSTTYKTLLTALLLFVSWPGVAFADCVNPTSVPEQVVCQFTLTTPAAIFATVYNILFPIGLVFGIFTVATAGYKVMTSQGVPEKVKEGSEDLTSAVLGLVFIVLSLVILKVIINSLLGDSVTF